MSLVSVTISRLLLCLAALPLCLGTTPAVAQEVREQPTPFTAWVELATLQPGQTAHTPLPIWVESIRRELAPRTSASGAAVAPGTVVRVQLRRTALHHQEVQLRLFFQDLPGEAPQVRGWTEIGQTLYESGPLGDGLGLNTSETVIIPAGGVDYLEITAPGREGNLLGVFLTTVARTAVAYTPDFGGVESFVQPFGAVGRTRAPAQDTRLFSRVKATLQAEAFKISAHTPADWQLTLEANAGLAMLTFEVLNADGTFPPEVQVNGRSLGAVSVHWPDLEDPAYVGQIRPREREPRYKYEGWVRCQKLMGAAQLRSGENHLRITVSRAAGVIAIRNLELQLKELTPNLDYINAR